VRRRGCGVAGVHPHYDIVTRVWAGA
jgi:hypothetical protein